jgi:hypothetical protein
MEYPVFAYKIEEKGRFYAFPSHKRLSRTSTRLLQSGIFNGVHFIDSSGAHYEVLQARKVKWGTWFYGYSLLYKGRQIIVDFDLKKTANENLDTLKKIILIDQQGNELLENEIIIKVSKATSIIEIISIFF